MRTEYLTLPGYGNSDENHWQTLWEFQKPNFKRVNQQSWNHPDCNDWIQILEDTVDEAGSQVKIVAHSLGCLLLSHWAGQTDLKIAGALLVAVPDPEGDNFPQQAIGFSPVAKKPFIFPSTVIASSNDPYSNMSFTKECATAWGSKIIELGAYGHINSDSGLADWPFGLKELTTL